MKEELKKIEELKNFPGSTENFAAGIADKLTLQRLEPFSLLLVPFIYGFWVFSAGVSFDPDSYYHITCAELYATQGWIGNFPWLSFTVLGENFTNMHLGQHIFLAPLTWFFEPLTALKLSVMILTSALAFSLYTVLKRWEIPHPASWALFGAFSSQVFIITNSSLKGGSLFFILFIWYVYAIWSSSTRRAFILAWLSVYVYVGAPVLIPVVLVFAIMRKFYKKVWEWKLILAVFLGLLAGYVANPFWADQWIHTARELSTVFYRPEGIAAGEFFGSEWRSLSFGMLLRWAALPAIFWFILFIRQLNRNYPIGADAAAGAVVAIGLLGASFLAAKFFHLFLISSILFLPKIFQAMKPWHKHFVHALLIAAIIFGSLNLTLAYQTSRISERIAPAEYQKIANQLKQIAKKGQVIIAPWDDFPGLFLYDRQNRYVAGLNPLFLYWENEKRFKAYTYLYQGKVKDPENLLPDFFEDAEIILVRRKPRNEGEKRLNERLQRNTNFEELQSDALSWKIFKLKKE